jgi:hypothetical protein
VHAEQVVLLGSLIGIDWPAGQMNLVPHFQGATAKSRLLPTTGHREHSPAMDPPHVFLANPAVLQLLQRLQKAELISGA